MAAIIATILSPAAASAAAGRRYRKSVMLDQGDASTADV
jgi:hypothetical protein